MLPLGPLLMHASTEASVDASIGASVDVRNYIFIG